MKVSLFSILLFLGHYALSQIVFEKGYLINNEDVRIECQIKNVDWQNNPTEFEYKLAQEDPPLTATIHSVKEFGISNYSKFIRAEVEIDLSTENLKHLSNSKYPTFSRKEIWLQVLVEGKASLYSYRQSGLAKYFYNVDQGTISQLVYRIYDGEYDKINEDKTYLLQLWNEVRCSSISLNAVTKMNYEEDELTDYFLEYNTSSGEQYVQWKKRKGNGTLHLRLTPGFNISSLSVSNKSTINRNTTFNRNISFRIGLETEFMLPFNKNKWSLLIEPSFNHFKADAENEYNRTIQFVKANHSSIELPLGIRHSFFLNKESKLFVNALLVCDLVLNSTINYEKSQDLSGAGSIIGAAGFGFNKKKFSVEFRYYSSRQILKNYLHWQSEYNKSSLIFGYALF